MGHFGCTWRAHCCIFISVHRSLRSAWQCYSLSRFLACYTSGHSESLFCTSNHCLMLDVSFCWMERPFSIRTSNWCGT